MRPLTVYKDRDSGTWYWSCRLPFCGANDWAPGGHPKAMQVAHLHISKHRNTGFGRAPRK